MIIGVLRWGWVEVILRVSLEVILHNGYAPFLSVSTAAARPHAPFLSDRDDR